MSHFAQPLHPSLDARLETPAEGPVGASPRAAALPAHLYGTRAALFHLLRESDTPTGFVPAPAVPRLVLTPAMAPAPTSGPAPALASPPAAHALRLAPVRPSAQIVPIGADPARTLRASVREMLMGDSFDFRDQA